MLDVRRWAFDVWFWRERKTSNAQLPTLNAQSKGDERVRGIEPPCAAWEAAVLPLNYTREVIFDFRFSIADCN